MATNPIVPGSAEYIQEEETDFRSPLSESMLQKIGGSINFLLDAVQQFAVAEIIETMLTEAQFQTIMGTGWVLCDGRNVAGSRYQTVTGNTSIPDARGQFIRSKNEGRSDGKGNPDGEIALGNYTADSLASHNHLAVRTSSSLCSRGNTTAFGGAFVNCVAAFSDLNVTIDPAGNGPETQPANGTFNWMIRIN